MAGFRQLHERFGQEDACSDLLVIGGGINGAGIAADASGRGLSVGLVDGAMAVQDGERVAAGAPHSYGGCPAHCGTIRVSPGAFARDASFLDDLAGYETL